MCACVHVCMWARMGGRDRERKGEGENMLRAWAGSGFTAATLDVTGNSRMPHPLAPHLSQQLQKALFTHPSWRLAMHMLKDCRGAGGRLT